MSDYEFYKDRLKEILSEKRFIHSVNVSVASEKLAVRYEADVNKAKIAGLLHDICKEMNEETLTKLLSEADFEIFNAFKGYPLKLYHGPAGAVYLQKEFGIDDKEILNAVCFHTTGHANMTTMEKIVFVADYISEERPFDNLSELQALALKNIDLVVLKKCETTIEKFKGTTIPVHPYTLDTYNDIKKIGYKKSIGI